jgi:UDP-N-acetylglucosamine 2-epimerase (non-hydrolysing)
VVQDLELKNVEYNLLTLHRNYNVDNVAVLENILKQLGELGEKIIFPVHPRTRKTSGVPGFHYSRKLCQTNHY